MACLFLIFAVDLVIDASDPSYLVLGLLDEPAHLATTGLFLLALARGAPKGLIVTALAASTLIDLDHLPLELGTDALTAGAPRPYSHSLSTPAALAGAALVTRRAPRCYLLAACGGVLAHLVRDLCTSSAVPLLWPLTKAGVHVPYLVYACLLSGLAIIVVARGHVSISGP